ncbi:MAG: GNAT family N-acetyltransferase [Oscillospiraceae bacterium]|nr:GNAT family N-acetyltransferase [Oscillospiraceae bacterium]
MIKEIAIDDLEQALSLVNRVFAEFVAVDYGEQGRNTFTAYLKNKYEEAATGLNTGHKKLWGYYKNNSIVGVIGTRDTTHISLMFVDKKYHKQGIAKELFNNLLSELSENREVEQITVNSSPYAVGVYEHLGFVKTDAQQEKDGIIYVPMSRLL